MIAVVNDANILIDIIKLNLVAEFFTISWEFHSPSIIVYSELYDSQVIELTPYIKSGKLILDDFSAEELEEISLINRGKPQLSDKDCSAFFCAKKLNAALITSDNNLRSFAKSKRLDVHGHFWVLDHLVEEDIISPEIAILKLAELDIVNPRLKLHREECDKRIALWSKR